MMNGHDGSGFGWVGWLLMSVLMLSVWALVIFGGLALVRGRRHTDESPERGAALDGEARHLLDERFARGEIDENDYARHRDLLSSGR